MERAHDYLERSLPPGRTFTSSADLTPSWGGWLDLVNRRNRRVLGCARSDRIPTSGWNSDDYLVHPAVIGRLARSSPACTGSGCSSAMHVTVVQSVVPQGAVIHRLLGSSSVLIRLRRSDHPQRRTVRSARIFDYPRVAVCLADNRRDET